MGATPPTPAALRLAAAAAALGLLLLACCPLPARSQNAGVRDRARAGPSREYVPQKPHPCEQSSCYPATGNLLIGREHRLTATSTCGLNEPQKYCIVSHLQERKKCFLCDSRPSTANKPEMNHYVSNIVYRLFPGTLQKSWWQSENGRENVTIQLDLEAEFHFTHLVILFRTFRPAAMLIERSYDFGKSWKVYRYFAAKCSESFPHVRVDNQKNLTDVVCEERYSTVEPSKDGEIIFRVLPRNVHIGNPYTQEVQNLLKMTNLRINFTKLHTLGDDLLDRREEIQEKYYYAIYDMVVRGSCSCYGHANNCLPLPGVSSKPDMVHGQCKCTHNTQGSNCKECKDFYNDLPWQPAIGKQTNACKKCNCNNHATRCHFDETVYMASGNVSGGVCDDCEHNTMGIHCDQCKPLFYRDPSRDMEDPEVCRPCDCDPYGSVDDAICDSFTDEVNGLQAGNCHCKTNVEGRRCDACKSGYWNFDLANPDGCEPCSCHTLGTVNNQGCNVYTGECTCKPFVTGRDCNQCLPEFWGLSEERDGCKPCDCDPGGSLDNNCDVLTGQCQCRDHVHGRTCSKPKQHYFTATIERIYEVENAKGPPTSQVVIREPYPDRESTWTGAGLRRIYEGSQVEIIIDDIHTPMFYDIAVRYEPQLPGNWEEAIVTVQRPDPPDPKGPCADAPDYYATTAFPMGSRSVNVYPSICLEPNRQYKMVIYFKRYNSKADTPSASILVDSVVLIPRTDDVPFFHGSAPAESRRQEYERNRCREMLHVTSNISRLPEACQKLYNSIGIFVNNGASPCQCDPTGSLSKLCSHYGGHCPCKPNVVGRTCDRCAPGTFGFGPEGCTACDCNSIGALDNFCDPATGQCKCRPNTYGRECDQCQPGYWNFPNCQRCECNGHADVCESKTGACTNCRDNTMGHTCDSCIEGHYGDPRLGVDIHCRPCPCPGIAGSSNSFAENCSLDPYTKDVICECKEGYSGSRCDVCADNFFGNPSEPGGMCQPCDCSNNVDAVRPGNCDPETGKCLQCLFDTEGDHCERCKANYYRTSVDEVCQPCSCNILGTNTTAGPCDRESGQCKCFKNVIGKSCDACIENHWKLASGEGCEACDCDQNGSMRKQCNPYDGKCDCREGFGGRKCDQCRTNYWGNPNVQCFLCECDPDGSETMQCARDTGNCVCKKGIGGKNCDTCARGYWGTAPVCTPCGECFDNWDRILDDIKARTDAAIEEAKEIKKVGVTGAYTKEFEDIEEQLDDIERQINGTAISSGDMETIDRHIAALRNRAVSDSNAVNDVSNKLSNTSQRVNEAKIAIEDLKNRINEYKRTTDELKANSTILKEGDMLGALSSMTESKAKAESAHEKSQRAEEEAAEAERQCSRIEKGLSRSNESFMSMHADITAELDSVERDLEKYRSALPDLNEKVCDKRGDPCDSLCGGAGCGSCGGTSCEQGAVKKAQNSVIMAATADKQLREKEAKADELYRAMTLIKTNATNALAEARKAHDVASAAYNESVLLLANRDNSTKQVQELLEKDEATPDQVRKLAKETLAKRIELDPAEITSLANKINNTLNSLKNIDEIIEVTSPELEMAKSLKQSAEKAREHAQSINEKVNKIVETLDQAEKAQKRAEKAINKTSADIDSAEQKLIQIGSETHKVQEKANKTASDIDQLTERFHELQKSSLQNNLGIKQVKNETSFVEEQASQTRKKSQNLKSSYDETKKLLEKKADIYNKNKERADDLLKTASRLNYDTNNSLQQLQELKRDASNHSENLQKKKEEIDLLNKKMNMYIEEINKKIYSYKTC